MTNKIKGAIINLSKEREVNKMKLYEVRVEKVTFDRGFFNGYENIAFCRSEEKAREAAIAWAREHEVNQWWCAYGKNKDGHINVQIVERADIIE